MNERDTERDTYTADATGDAQAAVAQANDAELRGLLPPLTVDRRGFVKTSLGAGFAVAVLPVQAQTVITTDAQGLTAGEVKIPLPDGSALPAYRAQPAGKTGLPVVLVIHEIFGVHEYIKDVTRRLAKLGYMAVAPDLFARHGDATRMQMADIMSKVVPATGDPQVLSDLDATAAWAAKNGGGGKLGITGFCWGGRIAWMYAAHNPQVAAGVAWYGNVAAARVPGDKSVTEVAGRIKAPMLGLYGGADNGIPPETVVNLMAALKAAGNTQSDLVVYPDAGHAFHSDYRPTYRKDAAENGWNRLTAWFAKYLQ